MNCKLPIALLLLLLGSPLWAAKKVDLDYRVQLLPQSDQAEVRLTLAQGSAVRSLDFDLGRQGAYSDFQADGEWRLLAGPASAETRGIWRPASGKASLTYRVRLTRPRQGGGFDTRMTANWALFRGEDLVPAAQLDQQDGVELVSRLAFELPTGWKSVETAWPRIGKNRFRINNPSRLLDRPTGWMLAGSLGSRRARLGETDVTVVAPQGQRMRRMDVLTLLTFVWPQAQAVFARNPGKLLIVGAGDPMGRGALAENDSIYLHSGQPLISESGASPLIRELAHALGRIKGRERSTWISEGLAEYYSIEWLRRAGGLTDERYQRVQAHLTRLGRNVGSLRGGQIDEAVVARAVLLLQELDREIRIKTGAKRSLDDVSRALMRLGTVNTNEFIQLSESVLGGRSTVLTTALLR